MLRTQVHLIRQIQLLLRSKWVRPTAALLVLLFVMPVAALAQSSPFDTGFNAIQGLFTGTIEEPFGRVGSIQRANGTLSPSEKVESWQSRELTDVTAKVVIYEAFVEGGLEAAKHVARTVYDLYFEPKYEEFRPRTIWSLSNAFTSAFKELEPIPQFKLPAKLGEFLEARFSQAF